MRRHIMPYIVWIGVVLMVGAWIVATTHTPHPDTATFALILYMTGLATPIVIAVAEIFRGPNR